MFDIHTEAYLRRTNSGDQSHDASPIIFVVVAANLILWMAVLIAAL